MPDDSMVIGICHSPKIGGAPRARFLHALLTMPSVWLAARRRASPRQGEANLSRPAVGHTG
jgi:hypothetical protein